MIPWKTAHPFIGLMEVPPPPGVVSLVNTNDWRKYQKSKMSEKEMLQAYSVGRVKLKFIVRDFSDLQPREVIKILAILFGLSKK